MKAIRDIMKRTLRLQNKIAFFFLFILALLSGINASRSLEIGNHINLFDRNKIDQVSDLRNRENQEFHNIFNNPRGKTYYVDKTKGNDDNSGLKESLAFKTINRANQAVALGDIVYVKKGIYNENITVKASGKSDQWIVFKAFPGHKPVVKSNALDGTFSIKGNYIEIKGFEIITTSDGSGIYVGKNNHHVKIISNKIHDAGCGGISGQETDYLYIEANTVYRNGFRAVYQCSGISIYQAISSDTKSGFHNIIRRNISYANENKVTNYNGKITDGNGIIIDDFRHTQGQASMPKYTGATLVENNIVFNNGGRGIHVFESDNVVVRNNTSFQNLASPRLDGTLNGELSAYFSSNVKFYNNIASARDTKITLLEYSSMGNAWDYNLSHNGSVVVKNSLGNHNLVNFNPIFVKPSNDPMQANFRLQSTSPAINAGTDQIPTEFDFDGNKRPLGEKYDMGAYEFIFSSK